MRRKKGRFNEEDEESADTELKKMEENRNTGKKNKIKVTVEARKDGQDEEEGGQKIKEEMNNKKSTKNDMKKMKRKSKMTENYRKIKRTRKTMEEEEMKWKIRRRVSGENQENRKK